MISHSSLCDLLFRIILSDFINASPQLNGQPLSVSIRYAIALSCEAEGLTENPG